MNTPKLHPAGTEKSQAASVKNSKKKYRNYKSSAGGRNGHRSKVDGESSPRRDGLVIRARFPTNLHSDSPTEKRFTEATILTAPAPQFEGFPPLPSVTKPVRVKLPGADVVAKTAAVLDKNNATKQVGANDESKINGKDHHHKRPQDRRNKNHRRGTLNDKSASDSDVPMISPASSMSSPRSKLLVVDSHVRREPVHQLPSPPPQDTGNFVDHAMAAGPMMMGPMGPMGPMSPIGPMSPMVGGHQMPHLGGPNQLPPHLVPHMLPQMAPVYMGQYPQFFPPYGGHMVLVPDIYQGTMVPVMGSQPGNDSQFHAYA